MPNKLRDVFSDKEIDSETKISFKNYNSYNKFIKALEVVNKEGKEVEVDVESISKMTIKIKDGEIVYPVSKPLKPTTIIIGPSKEDIPFVLNTEYGTKTMVLKLYQTEDATILETEKNEIVYFKFIFNMNAATITFTYKAQFWYAKTIKEIVESCDTAVVLLNNIFKYDDSEDLSDEYALIYKTRNYFLELESFFKRLFLVEQELQLSFNPTQINDAGNDEMELEKLFLLLIEKKVIRVNAKINGSKIVTVKSGTDKLKVGSKVALTFIENLEYTIYGKKIIVYTANLVCNAIVKDVKESGDGAITVLYGDTDSQPMYISYSGFKTYEEANQEAKTIMEHKDEYTNALTVNDYIKLRDEADF